MGHSTIMFLREMGGWTATGIAGAGILAILLINEQFGFVPALAGLPTFVGIVLSLLAIVYFVLLVVILPVSQLRETLGNGEYMFRTLVSGASTILAFGLVFLSIGLSLPDDITTLTPSGSIYFSMVTFSTLGYGDFTPPAASRTWAAFEAILGNLHLGLFVAGAFSLLQSRD